MNKLARIIINQKKVLQSKMTLTEYIVYYIVRELAGKNKELYFKMPGLLEFTELITDKPDTLYRILLKLHRKKIINYKVRSCTSDKMNHIIVLYYKHHEKKLINQLSLME